MASVSMAAAAVKLAGRIFPSLKDQSVLFIGAGEMITVEYRLRPNETGRVFATAGTIEKALTTAVGKMKRLLTTQLGREYHARIGMFPL